jgi:hypothetical protein
MPAALDENDDAKEPDMSVLNMRPSLEKGEDLYFVDAFDAPLEMEIAPSISLLVTPTSSPSTVVSDHPNTVDSGEDDIRPTQISNVSVLIDRGATNVPDLLSGENADCFEDDLVKSICTS